MLNSLSPARRGLGFAIAVVAVTFLLLRPMCAAWFAHTGAATAAAHAGMLALGAPDGNSSVKCCASASAPNPAAPPLAASTSLPGAQELAFAALLAIFAVGASLARQQHWRRAPPPPPQSFYLRSARILR